MSMWCPLFGAAMSSCPCGTPDATCCHMLTADHRNARRTGDPKLTVDPGTCWVCDSPRPAGHRRYCTERHRTKAKRDRLRAAGRCPYCGQATTVGFRLCDAHRAYQRQWSKAKRGSLTSSVIASG